MIANVRLISRSSLVRTWVTFLVFSSIYAINLPLIGNSSYWSWLLIFPSLLIINSSYSNLRLLVGQRIFYLPLISLIFIALLSFVIPIFYFTYDISMLKTWVNNLVAYMAMAVLACILCSSTQSYKDVFSIIFKVFLFQALIIWSMLIFPDLRESIQSISKSAGTIEKMDQYGGIRGLGLTSMGAFGLAVIMGLMGLFLSYYYSIYMKNNSLVFKIVIFFIAFIASISAGRSALAGFFIGFLFYYVELGFSKFMRGTLKVAVYSFLVITPIIVYILATPELNDMVTKYYTYAFKFVYMYFAGDQVSVSSLSTLEQMYFPLTEQQILVGEGRYTGNDGAYYLHTDPGFMRFTLLFGLFPSLFIYLSFLYIMLSYYLLNKGYVKQIGVLVLFITGLAFIYHYKGELIMFNVSYMKIIYFVFLYF
jgi:hypothetical protein